MSSTASRHKALAGLMAEHQLELLLVDKLVNVRYLTGFSGTSGFVVASSDRLTLLTDFRYDEQAKQEVGDADVVIVERDIVAGIIKRLNAITSDKAGFDQRHMTVALHQRLESAVGQQKQLVQAAGLVEQLRAVKDSSEVEKIRDAASIATEAFEQVISSGLIGRTETDIAWQLEVKMRDLGAKASSFPPIVASGKNAAQPHAVPQNVEIQADTAVVIDWGCVVDGYCSDCTRTVSIGDLDGQTAEVYELVRKAQCSALSQVQAGVAASDVDAAARSMIDDRGFGEQFGHGTGHGVGLEIHEAPRVAKSSQAELVEGNVITVEPGIYVPGEFGVRIEDLVVVTDSGCEVLTGTDKSLLTVH